MDRAYDAQEVAPGLFFKKIYGLSTDTKQTNGIANGSIFIELDTSDIYWFDEENTTWLKVGESDA